MCSLRAQALHKRNHPFSRSYGAILPSSLARVLSRALAFSACLPVSDFGTVSEWHLVRSAISRQRGFSLFALSILAAPRPLSPLRATGLARDIQHPGKPSLLRHQPDSSAPLERAGILTCCPSPTPFGLDLGPPYPGRTNLPQETLGFRRAGFSPAFSLLLPGFSLLPRPAVLTVCLQPNAARSSTTPHPKMRNPRRR